MGYHNIGASNLDSSIHPKLNSESSCILVAKKNAYRFFFNVYYCISESKMVDPIPYPSTGYPNPTIASHVPSKTESSYTNPND